MKQPLKNKVKNINFEFLKGKLFMNKVFSITINLSLMLLVGCNTTGPYRVEPSSISKKEISKEVVTNSIKDQSNIGETNLRELSSVGDVGITPPKTEQGQTPQFDKKTVSINASNLPVSDFIDMIFNQLLELDYVLDGSVRTSKVKATLSLSKPTSKTKLFELSKNILLQNNISLTVKNDVYFFKTQSRNDKQSFNLGVGRLAEDVPEVSGQILHIAPLYYADWKSMSRVALSLTSAKFQYLKERNAVLITGNRRDVLQVIKILNAFDRPSAKGRHIGIVELVYLTPEEFREQIEEIFTIEGIALSKNGNEGIISITPMSRMRAALIHSASETVYQRVMYWAKKLDIPSSSDGRKYFTYFPQNVSALDMGASLSQLFSLASDSTQKKSTSSNSKSGEKSGASAVTSKVKDLAMTVDEIQNALVFYATPSKYHETLSLIEQLDVLPGQILIEAAVVEVTLEGGFSRGVDWSLSNGFEAKDKQSSLSMSGGLSYVLQGVDFGATISFLESNSKVNIVSRPRILVRDGRSASMNVGTQVPIITQTVGDTANNNNQVLQTVQYQSTGVSLSVTPTINAKGVVSLTLNQTVSEAGVNKLSDISSPIILNRSFNTELLALDGKTIILGGLISENNSDGGSNVPLLGSIPIIGNLFSTENRSNSRVELVVMITPRIISSEQDIDDTIDAFSREFQNLNIDF